MAVKKFLNAAILAAAGVAIFPGFCVAESFTIGSDCGVKISSSQGNVECSSWQKGSKATYETIDVATCICANTCLKTPTNYYYYDDPVNKTKQTDTTKITLPVVLAWDHAEGWLSKSKSYVWYWPAWSVGGSDSATSDVFGVRSYLLEIDNTNKDLNDSKSSGGIFRRILTTNEFNAQKLFYPCFFNSATTYKWRVRPCCNADGSNCLPENQAEWQTFTTSAAPEPINADDPDWNGSGGATDISFDGFQIKWCRVYFQKTKRFATSYKLNVTSDESGSQQCHPLMMVNGECRDDDIYAEATSGKVYSVVDTDGVPKIPFPTNNIGRQDHALFTRNRTYVWRLKTCYDDISQNCSDYGQAWKFSTKTDPIGVPTAMSPKNDVTGNELVGLPLGLSWSVPDGANSFIYETTFTTGERKTPWKTVPNDAAGSEESDLFDADNIAVDTDYKWRVRACSNFNSTNCDSWSEWFTFRTTGRAPKTETLTSEGDIPVTLSWEAVPGAMSYNLSFNESGADEKTLLLKGEAMMKSPKYALNYPAIDQGKTYYWKVQTCAHDDGRVCGNWSEEKSFETGALDIPAGNVPAGGDTIYADQLSQELSWSKMNNAAAYRYTLTLANPADTSDCTQEPIQGVTNKNSVIAQMKCLGQYTLAVEACIDAQCQSVSPKGEWEFTLDQHVPQTKSVFALCGAGYDNPDTPWNERSACEPRHGALMIKVFLDFLIFKLSIFLLPFLILITAFLFYSPFGTPDLLEKVKMAWKAIGIGYALLIFGWLITGLILSLVGFQGLWWKIL